MMFKAKPHQSSRWLSPLEGNLTLVAGVLAEIVYAFDTLGADGVSMTACYGVGADAS